MVQSLSTFLFASTILVGPVLSAFPSTLMLFVKFGDQISFPSECSVEDRSVLLENYVEKAASTKLRTQTIFDSEKTGRIDYALSECADEAQIAELELALKSTVKELSKPCQAAVLSSQSIGCAAIYNEAEDVIAAKVKKSADYTSSSWGCPEWCVPYCYYVTDCYCWYFHPLCDCCNCPIC